MRKQSTLLRQAGLKVTLPRVSVLGALSNPEMADKHLTAEDIYRYLIACGNKVSLGAIYQSLTQFEEVGLVARHNFHSGQAVFELADKREHDHMVYVDTGDIIEFSDPFIEERSREIAQKQGYEVVSRTLVLEVRKTATD